MRCSFLTVLAELTILQLAFNFLFIFAGVVVCLLANGALQP